MALPRGLVQEQRDSNSFTDSQEAAVNHRGMLLGYGAVTCLPDVALWLRQGCNTTHSTKYALWMRLV
jgi:hypothetical protein